MGVKAAIQHKQDRPMVCLATAHPGKFGEAVRQAIGPQSLPESLERLKGKETRCKVLKADAEAVKQFIDSNG